MRALQLLNSKEINDSSAPYVIAEFNTSHFGNKETAKEMIKSAKEIGVDCVKFQSWSVESLYSRNYYDQNPIAKRMVKKLAFNEEVLLEMAKYCVELGIGFASTPYSEAEVDFLVDKCKVPFLKIASMELNNYPYLKYIAQKGAPIILSTGMGDLKEIHKAVKTIEEAGNTNICILHCISIYPPELSTINLSNIKMLRKEFPNYLVGFSDHSLGTEMSAASIAMGAAVIEKHFTLDKKRIGLDNQMALEPDEFKLMIDQCNNVKRALGTEERIVLDAELEMRKKMRRSIVTKKDLFKGHILNVDDLYAKRPGDGMSPEKINEIVGKKINRDIRVDELIFEKDITS
jgi:sialic acid synthase SpsE